MLEPLVRIQAKIKKSKDYVENASLGAHQHVLARLEVSSDCEPIDL